MDRKKKKHPNVPKTYVGTQSKNVQKEEKVDGEGKNCFA